MSNFSQRCVSSGLLLIVGVIFGATSAYGTINNEIREPYVNDFTSFLMMILAVFGACLIMLNMRK